MVSKQLLILKHGAFFECWYLVITMMSTDQLKRYLVGSFSNVLIKVLNPTTSRNIQLNNEMEFKNTWEHGEIGNHPWIVNSTKDISPSWRWVLPQWNLFAVTEIPTSICRVKLTVILPCFFDEMLWNLFRTKSIFHANRGRIKISTRLIEIVLQNDIAMCLVLEGKHSADIMMFTKDGWMRTALEWAEKMKIQCTCGGLLF